MHADQLDFGGELCPGCGGTGEIQARKGREGVYRKCPRCHPDPVRLDLPAGRRLAEQGMTRAATAAPPDWKDAAVTALNELIEEGNEFTADDVWERIGFMPPEPRALGAYLRLASKGGRIVQTGARRPSQRPEHHAYPMTVWRPTGR